MYDFLLEPKFWISIFIAAVMTQMIGAVVAIKLPIKFPRIRFWKEDKGISKLMEAAKISNDPTLLVVQYVRFAVNVLIYFASLILMSIFGVYLMYAYEKTPANARDHFGIVLIFTVITFLIFLLFIGYFGCRSGTILNWGLMLYLAKKETKSNEVIEASGSERND
jgi:hypothetical protein